MKKNLLIATFVIMAAAMLGGCGVASNESGSSDRDRTRTEHNRDDKDKDRDKDKDKDKDRDRDRDKDKDKDRDKDKDKDKDRDKDEDKDKDDDGSIQIDEEYVDDPVETDEYTYEDFVFDSDAYEFYNNEVEEALEKYNDVYSDIYWVVDGNELQYSYVYNTAVTFDDDDCDGLREQLQDGVEDVIESMRKASGIEDIGVRYTYYNSEYELLFDEVFY